MVDFSANGSRRCSKCGGTAKRLISAPQIVFHGSGFYVTDNKHQPATSSSGAASDKSIPTDTSPGAKPKKSSRREAK